MDLTQYEQILLKETSEIIERGRREIVSQGSLITVSIFWKIGRRVNEEILKSKRADYGKEIVSRLATQLTGRYGRSFEARNLRRMMQFSEGLTLGAIDYISKPFVPPLLRKRIELHLTVESQRHRLEEQARTLEDQQKKLLDFNENLQRMVEEKTGKVLELQDALLKTVADLVESRDDITGGHVERTQHGLHVLVSALDDLGLSRDQMEGWNIPLLLQSSQLHDVGKISISDQILNKPGKLTPEEFDDMKKHTTFGVKIIEKMESVTAESDFLKHAKIFAGTHHEKWDGTGYPYGIAGEDIPLQGRLMAIADVYDALVSERPYKKAFSHGEAVRIILEGRETHFDPVLTDVFEQTADRFQNIAAGDRE